MLLLAKSTEMILCDDTTYTKNSWGSTPPPVDIVIHPRRSQLFLATKLLQYPDTPWSEAITIEKFVELNMQHSSVRY